MSDLIVIESTNAVSVLSTDDGIKTLLDNVRANIDSMDGGSMKNKSSRQKIRSNAFAATKAFKKINDETIEPLIADLTKKIQPQLNVINAVKANQSVLQGGLQQIRKDVNADVDAFEAELQKIEDAKIEAERVAAVDRDYDFAKVLYNEYLSQVILGESKIADMEKRAFEKSEKERIAREKKIADDAAAEATLKSEQAAQAEKQRLIDEKAAAELEAENQRKAAIQAEIDLENEREQSRINDKAAEKLRLQQESESKKQAEIAEQNRINAVKEAKKQALIQANAAAEQAKQDEINRQEAEKLKADNVAATRAANTKHRASIHKSAKDDFIHHAGLTEDQSIRAVKALMSNKISVATINY